MTEDMSEGYSPSVKGTIAEFCTIWASKGIMMTIFILKQKDQEVIINHKIRKKEEILFLEKN